MINIYFTKFQLIIQNYLCITTSSIELATDEGANGKAMSSAHVM